MLGALTAIALVCSLEQPLPYRLLVIAGSLLVSVVSDTMRPPQIEAIRSSLVITRSLFRSR